MLDSLPQPTRLVIDTTYVDKSSNATDTLLGSASLPIRTKERPVAVMEETALQGQYSRLVCEVFHIQGG